MLKELALKLTAASPVSLVKPKADAVASTDCKPSVSSDNSSNSADNPSCTVLITLTSVLNAFKANVLSPAMAKAETVSISVIFLLTAAEILSIRVPSAPAVASIALSLALS